MRLLITLLAVLIPLIEIEHAIFEHGERAADLTRAIRINRSYGRVDCINPQFIVYDPSESWQCPEVEPPPCLGGFIHREVLE